MNKKDKEVNKLFMIILTISLFVTMILLSATQHQVDRLQDQSNYLTKQINYLEDINTIYPQLSFIERCQSNGGDLNYFPVVYEKYDVLIDQYTCTKGTIKTYNAILLTYDKKSADQMNGNDFNLYIGDMNE